MSLQKCSSALTRRWGIESSPPLPTDSTLHESTRAFKEASRILSLPSPSRSMSVGMMEVMYVFNGCAFAIKFSNKGVVTSMDFKTRGSWGALMLLIIKDDKSSKCWLCLKK